MTRPEFDTWIEQHYGELVAVAKRHGAGEDAVQNAVAGALANQTYLRIVDGPWPWMVNAVRGYCANARRAETRARENRAALRRLTPPGFSHGRKRPAPRAD